MIGSSRFKQKKNIAIKKKKKKARIIVKYIGTSESKNKSVSFTDTILLGIGK